MNNAQENASPRTNIQADLLDSGGTTAVGIIGTNATASDWSHWKGLGDEIFAKAAIFVPKPPFSFRSRHFRSKAAIFVPKPPFSFRSRHFRSKAALFVVDGVLAENLVGLGLL